MASESVKLESNQYITFRGKPLLRDAHRICYGDNAEPFVLELIILTDKKDEASGEMVPDMIMGNIVSTDPATPQSERVVKNFMKNGLYEALDYGVDMLEHELKKASK